jgi:copper chaperone CopZ
MTLTTVNYANAQDTKKQKGSEVKIKVFFHCANGKALIEKELIKEPGISKVVADLETKVVTVSFDSKKTNKEKIVNAIEKIGYATEFTPKDKKINKACSHDGEHKEGEKH